MERVEHIEDRVDRLLQRIAQGAERRDSLLNDVERVVQDPATTQPHINEINKIRYLTVPSCVENSAALAHRVEASASLAERSSHTVKYLDLLLQRVQQVKAMAQSMVAMEHNLSDLPRTLAEGDVEATVKLLRSYAEAERLLLTGNAAEKLVGQSETANATAHAELAQRELVSRARTETHERLLHKIQDAITTNDKLTIMHAAKLLAALDYREEGETLYCNWIGEHTIAALRTMVNRELSKMDDPTQAAMSHLALVSQALDTVAATFESEEEFTRETFGSSGPYHLLTVLHERATAQCVPVLRNFIDKRQSVLGALQSNAAKGRADKSNAAVVAADARRADQILEELCHLVSCCYVYLAFAEEKLGEYRTAQAQPSGEHTSSSGAAAPAAAPTTTSVDQLWQLENNALLSAAQDILSLYVPLQQQYFDAAFEQAVQLQLSAIHKAAAGASGRRPATSPRGARDAASSPLPPSLAGLQAQSPNAVASPSSFMAGLGNLYAAATVGGDALFPDHKHATATDTSAEDLFYMEHGAITLPDDTFFFLRIALQRAMNTKSTQITSAVVAASTDLISSKLVPQLEQRAVLQRRDFVPPRALRWASAGHQTALYTAQLAQELNRLADVNFSGRDRLRFFEQASDLDIAANQLREMVRRWLVHDAEVCYNCIVPAHVARLDAMSFELSEDMFYHYELNDPWVHACVEDLSTSLDYVAEHLDPTSLDTFTLTLAQRLVHVLEELVLKQRKRFTAFGALQLDKDVRALKTFFYARVHEVSLRATFASLTLICALLLSDSPRDALEEAHNTALSAAAKKTVLLCRTDFKKEDVMRLSL